ncbi:MAG: class I SAM-dependent methyltransferase [Pseudomonadota bacterium]
MTNDDQHRWDVFLDIQSGLPRQGPGCEASTLQALALCSRLPQRARVLDLGCGPGMQTITLAQAMDCHVTAVDLHRAYLDQLVVGAEAAGVSDRIDVREADMRDLPFAPASFDLIWSEGAIYNVGFEAGLRACHALLAPGGYVAVTELVWLTSEPPSEAAAFFAEEYPAMTDVATNLEMIDASGYECVGHFALPDHAWWYHYYGPLEAKLPTLERTYADDPVARDVIAMSQTEIAMRRQFPTTYGYVFFVGRKPD